MKKALLLVAMLAVAVSLVGGCGQAKTEGTAATGSTAPTKEPIKIGAILSLTGTYAGLGAPEKQAIELEVKRINDAGGVNGRPIEVVVEDDATDAQKAVAAATKLIDKDKVVAILGATGTGGTMAIRNEAKRAGVPVVSMAGGSVITADLRHQHVPDAVAEPRRRGLHALRDSSPRESPRSALLSSSDGYGKDGRQVVLDAVKADPSVQVVGDETFNVGDTDMTAQIIKLRAKGPQAIWLWNAGKEAAIVAKNLRQLDPDAHDQALRRSGQRTHRVHHRRRRGGGGLHVRRGQGPASRDVREGHRGVQGRDRLHRPLHQGVRQGPRHLRGACVRCAGRHGRRAEAREGRGGRSDGPRRDRGHDGSHRHRRDVHLLADRPQRPDREGPGALPGREGLLDTGEVARTFIR